MMTEKRLTTQSLNAAVAESLSWLCDYGFAYFKSQNQFRRTNKKRDFIHQDPISRAKRECL